MRVHGVFSGVLLIVATAHAQAPDLVAVADEIRTEVLLPNNGPSGRPLPVAAHWNTGGPNGTGFTPDYQYTKLLSGNHIIPWFAVPFYSVAATDENLAPYVSGVARAASLNLPISFSGWNWEGILSAPPFSSLPAASNPNVIQVSDGAIRNQLDPMGPVDPWYQAGRMWGSGPILARLQQLYPDPPLILFVDNFEASKIPWSDIEASKRYMDAYGAGRTPEAKSLVIGEGWATRYRAFEDGFRSALGAWASKTRFIAFGNYGARSTGRWCGWYWDVDITLTEKWINPAPLIFNGGSTPYYFFDWDPSTDQWTWGPPGDSMNWPFMQKEALRLNPNFWLEHSIWDGEVTKRQFLASPIPWDDARYSASIEWGMWLTPPRSVREFRGWTDTVQNSGSYFESVLTAVDRIWTNPVLKSFWRDGQIVPNRAWRSIYNCLLGQYANEDREFRLDATANPPRPWDAWTKLPVWALAYVKGVSPNRSWLLRVHGPMGLQRNVGITIPEYGQTFVDVPVGGRFYLLKEGQAGAQPIDTDGPQPLSVSPASGAGERQQFTFTVRDLTGASDVASVQMLVTGTTSASSACFINYAAATNSLFLYNDGATSGSSLTPGAGKAENSQCALYGIGSRVAYGTTDVMVTLDLEFKPSFSGAKNIYVQASDKSENVRKWVKLGTWTISDNLPKVVSVDPINATGSAQIFTARYRDPNGAATIKWTQLLISTTGAAANACYIHYNPANNTFFLFDDAATGGSWFPAGSGMTENSQCVLRGRGSSGALNGTDLVVGFDVTFKPAFQGTKNVYLLAEDADQHAVPATLMGTWTAMGYQNLPQVVAFTQVGSAPGNSGQTFKATYYVPNGAAWAQILFTGSGTAIGECYLSYYPEKNVIGLFLNNVSGMLTVVPGSKDKVQNGQCTLDGRGSSVQFSQGQLILTVDLRFAETFRGPKKVLMQTLDKQDYLAQWKEMASLAR